MSIVRASGTLCIPFHIILWPMKDTHFESIIRLEKWTNSLVPIKNQRTSKVTNGSVELATKCGGHTASSSAWTSMRYVKWAGFYYSLQSKEQPNWQVIEYQRQSSDLCDQKPPDEEKVFILLRYYVIAKGQSQRPTAKLRARALHLAPRVQVG